jgi:hypothetical protein
MKKKEETAEKAETKKDNSLNFTPASCNNSDVIRATVAASTVKAMTQEQAQTMVRLILTFAKEMGPNPITDGMNLAAIMIVDYHASNFDVHATLDLIQQHFGEISDAEDNAPDGNDGTHSA